MYLADLTVRGGRRRAFRQNQDLGDWRDFQDFTFAQTPLFAITSGRRRVFCQNQDLGDWRDFQDFTFAQTPLFAISGNPAKTNTDERLPTKDEMVES